jgi:hypothetical protein
LVLAFCWGADAVFPTWAGVAGQSSNPPQAAPSVDDARCTESTIATRSRQQELLSLIASGDEKAFRAALQALPCLGVGESEDFYRSAGAFLERQPVRFLEFVAGSDALKDRLRYLVTMLPISLVDDLSAQITTIDRRITVLNSVHDASLDMLKHSAVSALQSEQIELKRIQSDQQK